MTVKYPPSSYKDVKGRVEQALFSYEADDICAFLSAGTALGQIVPEEHLEKLDLHPAIIYLNDHYDDNLLNEIHTTLEFYVENRIRIFNSEAEQLIDDNYEIDKTFDSQYLWAEKYFLDMFGLWSPRMIAINKLFPSQGKGLVFEYENFKRYTYCPMSESEVEESDCCACPFSVSKENAEKSVKCRYRLKIA